MISTLIGVSVDEIPACYGMLL